MKQIILFLQLLVVTTLLSAQNNGKKTTYFDAKWKPVKDKNKAAYYREETYERDTLFVVDYYINGTKQMVGQFSDPKGKTKTGLFTYFDEAGNKTSEGNYKNNKSEGTWMFWDSTGKLLDKGFYENNKPEGIWTHYHPNGKTLEEWTYQNNKIVNIRTLKADGTELTENDTFTFVEQMPEFPGGMDAMSRFLSTNLNYPVNAREHNIEGRVVLQLLIDKTGHISDIEVLKSPNDELEKEAVRVVEMMPNWLPGKRNKVPVAVIFLLPIVFKLN